MVQGCICALDEIPYGVSRETVGETYAHSDLDDCSCGEGNLHILHVGADAFCDDLRIFGGNTWEEYGKFFAAVTDRHVGGAQAGCQCLGDIDENLIPGKMPIGVVDVLEMVDVQHEGCQFQVASIAALQFACVHFFEPATIVKPCEGIDSRVFFDAANVVLLFADHFAVVANPLAQNMQEIETEVVRGIKHRKGDIWRNDEEPAVFPCAYGSVWLDIVKNGHLACAVTRLDNVSEYTAIGFGTDI